MTEQTETQKFNHFMKYFTGITFGLIIFLLFGIPMIRFAQEKFLQAIGWDDIPSRMDGYGSDGLSNNERKKFNEKKWKFIDPVITKVEEGKNKVLVIPPFKEDEVK